MSRPGVYHAQHRACAPRALGPPRGQVRRPRAPQSVTQSAVEARPRTTRAWGTPGARRRLAPGELVALVHEQLGSPLLDERAGSRSAPPAPTHAKPSAMICAIALGPRGAGQPAHQRQRGWPSGDDREAMRGEASGARTRIHSATRATLIKNTSVARRARTPARAASRGSRWPEWPVVVKRTRTRPRREPASGSRAGRRRREAHDEAGARSRRPPGDAAAVRVRHGAHDRQAQADGAAAVALAADEALEDLVAQLGRDARAVVLDGEHDLAVVAVAPRVGCGCPSGCGGSRSPSG